MHFKQQSKTASVIQNADRVFFCLNNILNKEPSSHSSVDHRLINVLHF